VRYRGIARIDPP